MNPSFDDIVSFLKAKTAIRPCPRCDTNNWNINTKPSAVTGLWVAKEDGEFFSRFPDFRGCCGDLLELRLFLASLSRGDPKMA